MPGHSPTRQRGFTLNEALVVMAIFALALVFVLPNLQRARVKADTNQATRGVLTVVNMARAEAVKRHSPTGYRIVGRVMTVWEDWDPADNDLATNGNGVLDGSEETIVTREIDGRLDLVTSPDGASQLSTAIYAPDGTLRSGGGGVHLTDPNGNIFRVQINSVTGAPRIEKWLGGSWSPRREAWTWNY